jgi:hypothetical protein
MKHLLFLGGEDYRSAKKLLIGAIQNEDHDHLPTRQYRTKAQRRYREGHCHYLKDAYIYVTPM